MVVVQNNTLDNHVNGTKVDDKIMKAEINTQSYNHGFDDSSHHLSTNDKINQQTSIHDANNTTLTSNNELLKTDTLDNEELQINELYRRKQSLLQHLTEEMHKYEQLCWDEMAITGIPPDETNFLSNHFNVRCNSETRNPTLTTNRILNPPNNSSTTNRSRGIAARLRFRNSRRSKSAHERIPESPQKLFHTRNKADLSPTGNSLTDHLIDDNSESKKSWKWWRLNKDHELFSSVRRRQSIGMIAEQYLRYFTNDKNGHTRGGSLPPNDDKNNIINNISKDEKKLQSENQKLSVKKSHQPEELLHILDIQHQNDAESNHVGTYPPAHQSHPLHHHSHRDQQQQYIFSGNYVQHEPCILMSRYTPANESQRINGSNQRVRHFSGCQVNDQPLFNDNRNNQLMVGYISQNNCDSSSYHVQTVDNIKKQSPQTKIILNNHQTFYPLPSSSSSLYASQAKHPNVFEYVPNTYYYSLQRNISSSGAKEQSCEAPRNFLAIRGGVTAPFIIRTPVKLATTTPITLSSVAPPLPPRAYGRTSIVVNNNPKSVEESLLFKVTSSNVYKTRVVENQQTGEIDNCIVNFTTATNTTSTINVCKPTTRMTEMVANLSSNNSRCLDSNDQHPYLNCVISQKRYMKPLIISNSQFTDKLPLNHLENGFLKPSEMKPNMYYYQQQHQSQLPSQKINYQPAPNTCGVNLIMRNQGNTIVNRMDLLKSQQNHCFNSNNHLMRNLINNHIQTGVSIKNDVLNTMNTKLQSSVTTANPQIRWMYKTNLSNNKYKNSESLQTNQMKYAAKSHGETLNDVKISQLNSLSSQVNAQSLESNATNAINHPTQWEINLGCMNDKSLPKYYLTPLNSSKSWRQIHEPLNVSSNNPSFALHQSHIIRYPHIASNACYSTNYKLPKYPNETFIQSNHGSRQQYNDTTNNHR
ncbi:hypothetical protein EWB00_004412 [Schistosoma japonicum]|uniref:Uncharacterized protein n=1 Tax=Schistosoma japonicum TaxID=6182 RepID=A0A4Z2D5A3_SCHJA|nr:hypothetical protein EWB00_004412 [Schistosoma japonicum]